MTEHLKKLLAIFKEMYGRKNNTAELRFATLASRAFIVWFALMLPLTVYSSATRTCD